MAAAIAALVEVKRNITACQYTSVAGLVVCLYDVFLLFPDELELYWKRKSGVSLARVCYLVNRYSAPFGLVLINYYLAPFRGPFTSKAYANCPSLGHSVKLILSADAPILLVLRVQALYSNRPWLKMFLWAFYGMTFVTAWALMLVSIIRLQNNEISYSPILQVCVLTVMGKGFQVIFIITVPFTLCMGGLIAYRALDTWRFYSGTELDTGPRLVHVILTDGSVWACTALVLTVANAVIWLFLPPSLMMLGVYLTWGLSSACISRFSINLSKAASAGSDLSANMTLSRSNGFAIPPSRGLGSANRDTMGETSIPMEPTRKEQA